MSQDFGQNNEITGIRPGIPAQSVHINISVVTMYTDTRITERTPLPERTPLLFSCFCVNTPHRTVNIAESEHAHLIVDSASSHCTFTDNPPSFKTPSMVASLHVCLCRHRPPILSPLSTPPMTAKAGHTRLHRF